MNCNPTNLMDGPVLFEKLYEGDLHPVGLDVSLWTLVTQTLKRDREWEI